jgi:MFS family permease
LAAPFVLAGVAIGCVETAEHAAVAALAPQELRGSAFGLLAFVQAGGNLAASVIAGLLWPRRGRPVETSQRFILVQCPT